MPISVTCACGKEYKFKDEVAGRRTKCAACGNIIRIPGERVTAASGPAPRGPAVREPKEASNALLYGGLGVAAGLVVIGLAVVGYCIFKNPAASRPVGPPSVSGPSTAGKPAASPTTTGAKPPAPASTPPPSTGAASPPPAGPTGPPLPAASEVLKKISDKRVGMMGFSIDVFNDATKREAIDKLRTVADWVAFLHTLPSVSEATAQFKSDFFREQLAAAIGSQPTSEQAGQYAWRIEAQEQGKVIPVTWLQYPGVYFGADGSGRIVVVRVGALATDERERPSPAAPPASPAPAP